MFISEECRKQSLTCIVFDDVGCESHVVKQFHQKAGPSLGFRGPWCLGPHSIEINGHVRKIIQKEFFAGK